MSFIKRLLMAVIAAATFFILSACSPLVNIPGKAVMQPKLANNHFSAADGTILPVRSWLPKTAPVKAIVIALHGFNDYSNSFVSTGNFLSMQGIACYAYDQRGFGRAAERGVWSGVAAYADDLSAFAREVRKQYPGLPLYLLGESMGGAVTIVAVTGNNPPPVDGIILIAPAVWGRETMPWYQRWLLAVTSHTVPWMKLSGSGLNITPSDNLEMRRALSRDPLVIKDTRIDSMYGLTNLMDQALLNAGRVRLPTLILYGKHDQVIPREPTFLMLGKVPQTARKAFYENGYHMLLRDLQGEKPLTDIAVWIADKNSALPFGTDSW
jgi:alpha-beta hydrolase superfamily lysophospholipase